MRKLNTYVHVHNDDGTSQAFGPGDSVPEWAASQITNPAVWEASAPEDSEPSESWTVAQLRAYADEQRIDLGDATKKADILKAIDGDATV